MKYYNIHIYLHFIAEGNTRMWGPPGNQEKNCGAMNSYITKCKYI